MSLCKSCTPKLYRHNSDKNRKADEIFAEHEINIVGFKFALSLYAWLINAFLIVEGENIQLR